MMGMRIWFGFGERLGWGRFFLRRARGWDVCCGAAVGDVCDCGDECAGVRVCDGRAVARYGVYGSAGGGCGESFADYADGG